MEVTKVSELVFELENLNCSNDSNKAGTAGLKCIRPLKNCCIVSDTVCKACTDILLTVNWFCKVTYDFTMIQGTDERPDEDSLVVLKVRVRVAWLHAFFCLKRKFSHH